MKNNNLLFVLTILLNLIIVSNVFATIINIPADYGTIQAGINAAVAGDVVLVQPGTYTENINFNGKNITVASLFKTSNDKNYILNTIIDGDNSGNVADFSSGENSNATLLGFTIRNGSTAQGAGIRCTNSSSPTLKNLIISGNTSSQYGGGILLTENNQSIIQNILLINNSAGINGGAIYCKDNANPELVNVTISNNNAITNGGGIYCIINANPILKNCILWDNGPQEIYFHSTGDANSITISYSDIEGGQAAIVTNGNGTVNWQSGNINSNPLFVNAGSDNYYLSSGSPCLSTATATGAPADDLDGRSRPLGSGYDMGCYEQYDDGTLPIVLTSFTAGYAANNGSGFVSIDWSTASENDINGFNVYRSENDEFSYAEKVNNELIPGTNTTQTHEYNYFDEEILLQNIQAGDEFWYWLEIVEFSGISNVHNESAHLIIPDEYEPELPPELPIIYGLYQNFPNPFNPSILNTKICFNLTKSSNVRIDIYNLKGQLASNLYNGYVEFEESSNPKVVSWNGRNENGIMQESGIYFYKMSLNGVDKEVKKLLLIR